ncbi:MAG TPA: D-2-hydroxyacid dehydrogenase family protein [Rhodopila sp.]|uniref:D-2-hydroxyacid dehydrogenase family protein n=1 Tax=Rhodopila sp. TaxID=2480087 RepID=UPI002C664AF3|nr:D-2-hydroxyacid dehydrogenase family protein [Rhodopila sp.]HVY18090.1 D-2-hydroxyacid dehydrogenase family protein [Rhodopila sp.]
MFRVALLDDYQDVALKMADWTRLAGRAQVDAIHDHIPDVDRLAERLRPYDAVMMVRERTKFPRPLFARLPNLKLLVTAAMWNVAIDLDAATEHGVQVTGTGDWSFATAELALGLMIALSRNITMEDRAMRSGGWQTTLGAGLHGKTLGILGLGSLGGQMARFGQVLGMEVLAWSQNLTPEKAAAAGARHVSKDELLARSDFVSIHLKLSDRTRGLLGPRELDLMKPGAYLINTSRGPIVDEEALFRHLRDRRIAGAGIDVYGVEPLPADHPLRRLENVILLPHVGYVVEQNYRVVYGETLEDIEAFLDGRVLRPLNALPAPRFP